VFNSEPLEEAPGCFIGGFLWEDSNSGVIDDII